MSDSLWPCGLYSARLLCPCDFPGKSIGVGCHFLLHNFTIPCCCCWSVAKSCPTLCDPMDCSMLSFPVPPYLLEFVQTHVCWVGDAIQPSHPLSPPSPALNISQQQDVFRWVSSSYQVATALELQLQHQSFQGNIQGWFPLGLTGLISMLFKEL